MKAKIEYSGNGSSKVKTKTYDSVPSRLERKAQRPAARSEPQQSRLKARAARRAK